MNTALSKVYGLENQAARNTEQNALDPLKSYIGGSQASAALSSERVTVSLSGARPNSSCSGECPPLGLIPPVGSLQSRGRVLPSSCL